jgi:hypothetical protein
MSTISIPASVLPDIREAVISFMGFATQDFNDGLTLPERERRHQEWFVPGRKQLEHLWGLLDRIGWREGDDEHDVGVDIQEYGQTILDATAYHIMGYKTWEAEAKAEQEAGEASSNHDELFKRGAALREFVAHLEKLVPPSKPSR